MKKNYLSLFIILSMLLLNVETKASHVLGYTMNMEYDSIQGHKFRVEFYRDITSPASLPLPNSFSFKIYINSNNTFVQNVTISRIAQSIVNGGNSNYCGMNMYELGIFESAWMDLSSLNNPNGYYISTIQNSRNQGIVNVDGNSSSYDLGMTMEFPRVSLTMFSRNSSPKMNVSAPALYLNVNKTVEMDWSATDPDGDVLVYSLVQPYGTTLQKPFQLIPFATGYGLGLNIMDGSPDISIHPQTGMLKVRPTAIGNYLVAVRVEEFRNGVKRGEIRREVEFRVADNPVASFPEFNGDSIIVDIAYVGTTYLANFYALVDTLEDIRMVYEVDSSEVNIFDSFYNASFGYAGNACNQPDSVLVGTSSISGEVCWTPTCAMIRTTPYYYRVIAFNTACSGYYLDTLHYYVYVVDTSTYTHPSFVSLPNDSVIHISSDQPSFTFQYSVQTTSSGETYVMVPGFENGYTHTDSLAGNTLTGVLTINPTCADVSEEPQLVSFITLTEGLCQTLTDTFYLHIYVDPSADELPYFISVEEKIGYVGSTMSFAIPVHDTSSKYNTIYAEADKSTGLFILNFPETFKPKCEPSTGIGTDTLFFEWNIPPFFEDSVSYSLRFMAYDNSCKAEIVYDTVQIKLYNLTGIDFSNAYNALQVYPNPVNDYLQIGDTDDLNVQSVELFDLQGKCVRRFDPESKMLDVSGIANGSYVLYLRTVSQNYRTKVMVLHE